MKLSTGAVVLLLVIAGCSTVVRGTGAQALPDCGSAVRVPCVEIRDDIPEALPGGWFRLFNGRDFEGWRLAEDSAAFRLEEGTIAADGRRSHLFYDGPLMGRNFRNFELQADVLTKPGANSAIYIHTHFMEGGWPNILPSGYEIQINNSAANPGRTASVYTFQDINTTPAQDNVWFTMHITVVGHRVQVRIDDRLVNDFTESADKPSRLTGGTFALQAHAPGEKTYFRNILVRPLPD